MKCLIQCAVLLLLTLASCSADKVQERRPNIILIMADDMGYECLSCNGSVSYKTPNLDRFAENGARFTKCISQPLCTPSRVKIMTGRYNYRNYCDFGYLDIKEKTFGNILQEEGYRTAVVGKWQLNGLGTKREGWEDNQRPAHFGFDEYCLWQLTKPRKQGERYANPLIEQNGKVLTGLEKQYGPDIFSNYVLNFIERNKEQPFFIYYPMVLVHDPFVATPDSEGWEVKRNRFKNNKKYFKDMVEYTDKIIGQIVQKLKDEGIWENTILMFTGDNGTNISITSETVNGAYKGGKGTTPDAGTHVPFVASWPAQIKEGFVYDELVEFSDFLPTIAQAGEAKVPTNIDGKSFLNVLRRNKHKDRETVLVHYDPMKRMRPPRYPGRFVRTKQYKLYHDGRFFNLEKDKLEQTPLDEQKLTSKEKQIKQELEQLQKECPEWKQSEKTHQ
ncbi:arylsulfatase A [Prolixibacteraceae bacterium JC049]|nr:arylsulfatase A [Prolixibacteraceae bacterium JC049]